LARHQKEMSHEEKENPFVVLGVNERRYTVDDEEIRRRYTMLVRENPPEKDREAFQRIRQAYEALRTARGRAVWALRFPDPPPPFLSDIKSGEQSKEQSSAPGPAGISARWWLAADPWSDLVKTDFAADCRQPKMPVAQQKLLKDD